MGTRGLVGYRKGNEIKAFCIENDSQYGGVGIKVLKKFQHYHQQEINDFFLHNVNFVENKEGQLVDSDKDVWRADWRERKLTLVNFADFLSNGLFCEYAYLFNLDSDTLELYRGGFEMPQARYKELEEGHKEVVDTCLIKFYTHLTAEIKRPDIEKTKILFGSWDRLSNEYYKFDYPELYFLANEVEIS